MNIFIGRVLHQRFSTDMNDLSEGLMFFLAIGLTILQTVFLAICFDIVKVITFNYLGILLSSIVIYIFIVIPFLFFYFQSETEDDSAIKNKTEEEQKRLLKMKHSEEDDDDDRSESYYYPNDYDDEETTFCEYFFCYMVLYIIIICFLYLLYRNVILFPRNAPLLIIDSYAKLKMIYQNMNVLGLIHWIFINMISKGMCLIYIPLGFSRMILYALEPFIGRIKEEGAKEEDDQEKSLKRTNEINVDIDKNMMKNYETIQQITTQIMTGKSLSREQKELLKTCRENQSSFDYKKNIMNDQKTNENQETYSKFKENFFIVLKIFISIIIIGVIGLILLSKGILIYSKLHNNLCGHQCGYITNDYNPVFTYQSVLFYFNNIQSLSNGLKIGLSFCFILLIVLVYLYGLYHSIHYKGLINILTSRDSIIIPYNDLGKNTSNAFISYTIFFMIFIGIVLNIIEDMPSFTYFYSSLSQCNYDFSYHECSISSIGSFLLSYQMAFSYLNYYDITYTILFIVFTLTLTAYYMTSFFSKKTPNLI